MLRKDVQRLLSPLPFQRGTRVPPLCSRHSWPCSAIFSKTEYPCFAISTGKQWNNSDGKRSVPLALPFLTLLNAASSSTKEGTSQTSTSKVSTVYAARLASQSWRCSDAEMRWPPSRHMKKLIHLSMAAEADSQGWPSSSSTRGKGRGPCLSALDELKNGLIVFMISDAEFKWASWAILSAKTCFLEALSCTFSWWLAFHNLAVVAITAQRKVHS